MQSPHPTHSFPKVARGGVALHVLVVVRVGCLFGGGYALHGHERKDGDAHGDEDGKHVDQTHAQGPVAALHGGDRGAGGGACIG